MRHSPSIAVWYEPNVTPRCKRGEMIPVVVQREGKVFGGWYCNSYELVDVDDALEGITDEAGGVTGFCEKLPSNDFDEYFEFAGMDNLDCWAYMPLPRRTVTNNA